MKIDIIKVPGAKGAVLIGRCPPGDVTVDGERRGLVGVVRPMFDAIADALGIPAVLVPSAGHDGDADYLSLTVLIP